MFPVSWQTSRPLNLLITENTREIFVGHFLQDVGSLAFARKKEMAVSRFNHWVFRFLYKRIKHNKKNKMFPVTRTGLQRPKLKNGPSHETWDFDTCRYCLVADWTRSQWVLAPATCGWPIFPEKTVLKPTVFPIIVQTSCCFYKTVYQLLSNFFFQVKLPKSQSPPEDLWKVSFRDRPIQNGGGTASSFSATTTTLNRDRSGLFVLKTKANFFWSHLFWGQKNILQSKKSGKNSKCQASLLLGLWSLDDLDLASSCELSMTSKCAELWEPPRTKALPPEEARAGGGISSLKSREKLLWRGKMEEKHLRPQLLWKISLAAIVLNTSLETDVTGFCPGLLLKSSWIILVLKVRSVQGQLLGWQKGWFSHIKTSLFTRCLSINVFALHLGTSAV